MTTQASTTTPTTETPFAITSLVCGCVGIMFFWMYGILPVLAIVFGGVSIGKSRKVGARPSNMAIAGLVLGIIEIAVVILLVVTVIAAA